MVCKALTCFILLGSFLIPGLFPQVRGEISCVHSGNDDGEITAGPYCKHCFAVWEVENASTGKIRYVKQGCWEVSPSRPQETCGQAACAGITDGRLSDFEQRFFFCCCSSALCNGNVSVLGFLEKETTESHPTVYLHKDMDEPNRAEMSSFPGSVLVQMAALTVIVIRALALFH